MTLKTKLNRIHSIFKNDLEHRKDSTACIASSPKIRDKNAPLNLILFIGHHKVGSTSLQDFLARNYISLAREGILYPFIDFEGLSYAASLASGHSQIDGALPINIREPHNALAFRMMAEATKREVPSYHENLPARRQMFVAIKNQIRFNNPHTVILAAEVFANFNAVEPRLIRNLLSHFPDANITLVSTLRRIDEYIASWHGQRLKFGHSLPRLADNGMGAYETSIHFDYKLMLEGWVNALPNAKIILRNYTQVQQNGGSVADFFDQTGLKLPKESEPERRVNDSLHRATYEIARRGNHDLAAGKAKLLRKALRKAASECDLPPSNQIELFGPKNREKLVLDFQPIDSYIAKISGNSSFFPDLEKANTSLPYCEIECAKKVLEYLHCNQEILPDQELQQYIYELKTSFNNYS